MRKLIVHEFASLDGVMQAPGGPDEDRDGDFTHGGWTRSYWHDDISAPNVEKAWCNASGISECEETMPEVPSPVGCTGAAYSTGYNACCASTALRSASFASLSGMVRIQVMDESSHGYEIASSRYY